MATVGAYKLLCEWDGNMRDERFLALCDAYLNLLREMRFSSGHLTDTRRNAGSRFTAQTLPPRPAGMTPPWCRRSATRMTHWLT